MKVSDSVLLEESEDQIITVAFEYKTGQSLLLGCQTAITSRVVLLVDFSFDVSNNQCMALENKEFRGRNRPQIHSDPAIVKISDILIASSCAWRRDGEGHRAIDKTLLSTIASISSVLSPALDALSLSAAVQCTKDEASRCTSVMAGCQCYLMRKFHKHISNLEFEKGLSAKGLGLLRQL